MNQKDYSKNIHIFDVTSDDNPYRIGTDNPLTHESDNVEYTFYSELLGVIPLPGIGITRN